MSRAPSGARGPAGALLTAREPAGALLRVSDLHREFGGVQVASIIRDHVLGSIKYLR